MATVGLVITGLAFLVSLLFNLLQLKWRKDEQVARAQDKAEQKRKDDESEAGQRLKEQAAPLFFNFDGTPSPILVTGSQHSSQGPFTYAWGLVTVVNRTQLPVKITPVRLLLSDQLPVPSIMCVSPRGSDVVSGTSPQDCKYSPLSSGAIVRTPSVGAGLPVGRLARHPRTGPGSQDNNRVQSEGD
jgi:hypothetical protein